MTATVRWVARTSLLVCIGCGGNRPPPSEPPVGRAADTPPGVSSECLALATGAFVECTAECKTAPDPFNCCGSCDTGFATTFQNCCTERCVVDEPPDDCLDDSGPGCAGGVITPDAERPEHCG